MASNTSTGNINAEVLEAKRPSRRISRHKAESFDMGLDDDIVPDSPYTRAAKAQPAPPAGMPPPLPGTRLSQRGAQGGGASAANPHPAEDSIEDDLASLSFGLAPTQKKLDHSRNQETDKKYRFPSIPPSS